VRVQEQGPERGRERVLVLDPAQLSLVDQWLVDL
jgi:hypothetical protein